MKTPCPRTWAAFGALEDPEGAFAHVQALEAAFASRAPVGIGADGPDGKAPLDADVVVVGGGLSLLYALALARRGQRVVVADRRRIGDGPREWNVSAPAWPRRAC
ncbi:MAG: hypothetical protein ACK46X_11290 [Candidatus Sericytochromatia bacterium]